jgi:DNA-binding MarR family transcriptional regulator
MKTGIDFGHIFKSAKGNSNKHTLIGLTTLGKSKSESFEGSGLKFQVLSDLADNGASSITEIAGRVNSEPNKVKAVCSECLKQGLVRKMEGDE